MRVIKENKKKGERILKNIKMANKGLLFEKEVELTNDVYMSKKIAMVQKISTPWTVIRRGKDIVSAFPSGQSTLDFRGTVNKGVSISFDCKESTNEKGLPLSYIKEHQVNYMKNALDVGEITFLLVLIVPLNERYLIPGEIVVNKWDMWQKNKGKKGFNIILKEEMHRLKKEKGISIDYIRGIDEIYFKKSACNS